MALSSLILSHINGYIALKSFPISDLIGIKLVLKQSQFYWIIKKTSWSSMGYKTKSLSGTFAMAVILNNPQMAMISQ